MNWKQWMSKFDWKNKRDQWLFLLVLGMICMIMAMPSGKSTSGKETSGKTGTKSQTENGQTEEEAAQAGAGGTAASMDSYEQQMEKRVRELLKNVEGVGAVDVMIVLKSSEEKILHVDTTTSISSTRETDSSGGSRQIDDQEISQSTILAGNGESAGTPVVEKELKPEVSGVVISAAGGGSPAVQAEISQAIEALFGIPSHKIKVLKRAE